MLRIVAKAVRVHPAWIVLACAMVISAVNSGIRQTFGVMVDPLVQQFGWSRGAISLAYSLSFVSSIPITLLVGWLGETIGVRRILLVAALSIAGGLVLTGRVTQLWQFYFYYGVVLTGFGGSVTRLLMPVMVTRWFNQRLGLAMGLMWSSMGVGTIVLAPALGWGIENAGWTTAFLALGIVAGLLVLAASVIARHRPRDVGLIAYGDAPSVLIEAKPAAGTRSMPASRVISTHAFWALVIIHFLGCASHSLLVAHMVPMAVFAGIPGGPASIMLSVFGAATIGSRFVMSMLADSRGSRITLGLAMVLQTSPILILLWAKTAWAFYLFALLFGIGFGGEMVGFPIFNRQFYGVDAPLNAIYSYQMVGASVGMALGGWLGGVLFDLTGGYTWPTLAAIIAGYAGLLPIFWLPRHRRTLEPLLKIGARPRPGTADVLSTLT